jgi:putative redox protein
MTAEKTSFTNRRGQKLAGMLHLPDGTPAQCAVLAPCFTCTYQIAPIRDAARALERAGIAALRIDYAGSGESEGRFEDATLTTESEDAEDAARFVLQRFGLPRLHLIGHSMGGGVSLRAADALGPACASVTTISSDPRPDAFEKIFGREIVERARSLGKVMVDTGAGEYPLTRALVDDLAAFDFVGLARKLRGRGLPLLHLHGDRDELIRLEVVQRAAAADDVTLQVVKGGDHLFTDRDARARLCERVVKFVREGR